MNSFDLIIYTLKFLIPSIFSISFRAFGLGYKSRKRLILGFVVFGVYLTVIPAVLISLIGYGEYTHIVSIVMTIGGMSVLIFSNDPPGKTIFLQLIISHMNTVISVVLNMVRHIYGLSYLTLVILILIVCPIVYCIGLRFWARPLRFISDNIYGKLAAQILIPIVTMLLIYIIPVYPVQNFVNYPIYCTMLMLGVELIFFLYIYTLYRNLLQINILSKQELQWELLQSEIDSYQSFVQLAKQSRHDVRHHDAVILEYLETGDIRGAKDYLRVHDEALENSEFKEFCNHSSANAVLKMYERRSQESGVDFVAMADIPEKLPLTALELGGLLSNLLENALDACKKSDELKKYVIVSAESKDNSLLIDLRNTVSCETSFRDGIPISQKPGGGTGTKSVDTTVKKYNGMVAFSQHNNTFFVRIILPL